MEEEMYGNHKKHTNRKFTALTLVLLLAIAALFSACVPIEPKNTETGSSAGQSSGEGTSQAEATPAPADTVAPTTDAPDESAQTESAPAAGADLVIPLSDITTTATFYPATVNGIDLEVLAVKAPDGTIRTAFNTCQVCYDSGRGYYKQSGDVLVCQNCGNRFPMSRV
jgi:hypothetical protein